MLIGMVEFCVFPIAPVPLVVMPLVWPPLSLVVLVPLMVVFQVYPAQMSPVGFDLLAGLVPVVLLAPPVLIGLPVCLSTLPVSGEILERGSPFFVSLLVLFPRLSGQVGQQSIGVPDQAPLFVSECYSLGGHVVLPYPRRCHLFVFDIPQVGSVAVGPLSRGCHAVGGCQGCMTLPNASLSSVISIFEDIMLAFFVADTYPPSFHRCL